MAWRRGSKRFGKRRLGFGRRTPLARIRRTWFTGFFGNICEPTQIAFSGDCVTNALITLLDNSNLELLFSDRASVKRVLGDLWFLPTFSNLTGDCATVVQAVQLQQFNQLFVGLRRYERNQAGNTFPIDPLNLSYDLSESQFRKTWQHCFLGANSVADLAYPMRNVATAAVCPDVHTTGLPDNSFTDGTGTIDIETTCNEDFCHPCPEDAFDVCKLEAWSVRPWHLHLDVRRSIPMRENQELGLNIAFAQQFANVIATYSPVMQVFGNVRLLVQMG